MAGGEERFEALTVIRSASPSDIKDITTIYAYHVRTGTASFEIEPPEATEMQRRWQEVTGKGLPYLVAEDNGLVLGYAYAGPYRPRPAYRFTIEDSIYVHPEHARKGVGALLLPTLIAECEKLGLRQLIAVIGDSGNAGSVALHRKFGFEDTGILKNVGFKFGKWLDVTIMQRALGPGATTLPEK
ncbi:MAG: N-acetyltransferase family protein [Alphaproteobacteria bacterium]|nr:MAG: N-acetyltransferase family protein [Alphaproteobacteria bacterium]